MPPSQPQKERNTSRCGSQDERSKQMPGPVALSFSLSTPSRSPGYQRGHPQSVGFFPLNSPLWKVLTDVPRNQLLSPSKLTINISSSERRKIHRNPKTPLSHHILFCRTHPRTIFLIGIQRLISKCDYFSIMKENCRTN